MDVRVLKYFLAVAREGSITKATESLHVTQPTLSRQLMDLEEKVGVQLLIRGKRRILLTDAGILFQQRAKEIVLLLEKTERDLAELKDLVGGIVAIGCGETFAIKMLADALVRFSKEYPMVQYDLYTADGDDVREKLDRGDIDIGILLEPVEAAKYDYVRLPIRERWGVLVRRDDPLAQKESVSMAEILFKPLIPPRRKIVQDEIVNWLGEGCGDMKIIASHNLPTSASLLVEYGLGYAICVEGAYSIRPIETVCFVPFTPERITEHVLAWKKNRVFTSATSCFIQFFKDLF